MTAVVDDLLSGLLVAASQGDEQAFAELYRLSAPRMNAVVRRLTAGKADPGEALQEAYVRIWQSSARFDPARGSAVHWMAAVTRNVTIDLLRSRGREGVPIDEIMEMADPIVFEPGVGADIRRCLGELDANCAQVIILAYYSGYSHSELAQRLDRPLGTIKSWVKRGLVKLRDCLDEPV